MGTVNVEQRTPLGDNLLVSRERIDRNPFIIVAESLGGQEETETRRDGYF